MSRTSINGEWLLSRAPQRPEGSTELPDPGSITAIGVGNVPGNVHLDLGLEDLNLDSPELITVNHYEWLYARTPPDP